MPILHDIPGNNLTVVAPVQYHTYSTMIYVLYRVCDEISSFNVSKNFIVLYSIIRQYTIVDNSLCAFM